MLIYKRAVYALVVRTALMLMLFFPLVSCAGPQPARAAGLPVQKNRPTIDIPHLEKQIHALVNKERRQHGLSSLAWDDTLASVARRHSRDMAKRNYFDHFSPEGRDFSHRYRQEGYACAVPVGSTVHTGAENIALNHLYDSVTTMNGKAFYDWNSLEKIAETTVRGWMKSPGHRKNILTPHWRQEGIGIVISPDDKVYITQNFC